MKRSFGLWQFFGFAVTSVSGTVLHFLYGWLGNSRFIAPFSGVNESTWEHMKLLFWPMFVFSVIESLFFKDRKDFWCVKLRGILFGLLLIPFLFYGYNGIIGKSPDWVNISIFFTSALSAYIYEISLLNSKKLKCRHRRAAFSLICIIGFLFILFTFRTPEINIFRDPLTGSYGI